MRTGALEMKVYPQNKNSSGNAIIDGVVKKKAGKISKPKLESSEM